MKDTKATIHYSGDDYFVAASASGHSIVLDMKGERSNAPSPFELLYLSLGGCTGADVVDILRKKREKVTAYRIEVQGERREEHPRSLRRVHVKHVLHGKGLTEKAVAHAIQLSDEKYCGVAASLRPTAEIVTTFEIHEAE
jgi:putative redox protein